jgi:hypothetical protein
MKSATTVIVFVFACSLYFIFKIIGVFNPQPEPICVNCGNKLDLLASLGILFGSTFLFLNNLKNRDKLNNY